MRKTEKKPNNTTELFEVELTGNVEISEGVYLISWEKIHDFIPGQVIKLTTEISLNPRIYSICSGVNDSEMKVLFNVKDEGLLTPKLSGYIQGMKILVSKPYGSFINKGDASWLIATGTGIAPFYSMIKSGIENVTLLHGVSYLSQFYFEDELEYRLGNKYYRCCSRQSSCDVFPGRVSDFIISQNELPENIKYFLCGKAIMVVELRDLLISKGVSYDNILSEIYF